MLVEVREFTKNPERIGQVIGPIIGLKMLDDRLGTGVNSLQTFLDRRYGILIVGAKDRELRVLLHLVGECRSAINLREFIGQIIEGRSQIVSGISDQKGKLD